MPHIDSFSPSVQKLKELGAKRAVIAEAVTQINKALRVMHTSEDSIDRSIGHLNKAIDYLKALKTQ